MSERTSQGKANCASTMQVKDNYAIESVASMHAKVQRVDQSMLRVQLHHVPCSNSANFRTYLKTERRVRESADERAHT
jgi:hypothetical protein